MNEETVAPSGRFRILWLAAGCLFLLWCLVFLTGSLLSWRQAAKGSAVPPESILDQKGEIELSRKVDRMEQALRKMTPGGINIVIDSGRNILYLKKGNDVLREAVVSCGSGNVLASPTEEKSWVFDTPRGVFTVTSKIKHPAWIKPDWAFLEEGEPVPTDASLRYEPGVLGDYALGFGGGYFIHGTLYTRLLGRNVTHGCVRVGDEDLKAVFDAARIGTPIFIY